MAGQLTPADFPSECDYYRNKSYRIGFSTTLSARPKGARFQAIWFIVYVSMLAALVLLFAFFKYVHPERRRFGRIQHRSGFLVLITHLGGVLVGLICSFLQSRPLDQTLSCWAFYMAYYWMVPCLLFPLVMRLLRFYRETQWTALVASEANKLANEHRNARMTTVRSNPELVKSSGSGVLALGENESYTETPKSRPWLKMLIDLVLHMVFFKKVEVSPEAKALGNQVVTENEVSVFNDHASYTSKDRVDLMMLRFLKSQTGAYFTMTFIFAPYVLTLIIALAVNPAVRLDCVGCYASVTEEIFFSIGAVWAIVLLLIFYRVNLKRKDPFGLMMEIRIVIFAGGLPAVIVNLVNNAIRHELDKSDFQLTTIAEIFIFIFCFAQSGLQVILAIQDRRRESLAALNVAYSIKEFENEFLKKNGAFTEAFSRHLYNEHGYESFAFLSAVYDWEKAFFDISPKTARSRAKKICNMYVGDDAELPCNLSSDCVRLIKMSLEKVDSDIPYDFYVVAKGELIMMLYRDSWRRFIRSSEFKRLAKMQREIASSPGMMSSASSGV